MFSTISPFLISIIVTLSFMFRYSCVYYPGGTVKKKPRLIITFVCILGAISCCEITRLVHKRNKIVHSSTFLLQIFPSCQRESKFG